MERPRYMPACHKCARQLNAALDFGRQDTCEGCRSATHVCLNCLHYDPTRYNECGEAKLAAEALFKKGK